MKALIFACSLLGLILGSGCADAVRFQSLESKTTAGSPVFNEIKLISLETKDIWMMNQSHHGPNATGTELDRVAIVIDRMQTPKTAFFLQLKPGPLVWSEDLVSQRVKFKVSCFLCHANGPRIIRADWSGEIKQAFTDQLKINYLNQKMSYGLVVESKIHLAEDIVSEPPFRFRGSFENGTLKINSCVHCHDGEMRAKLTRQNALAIHFLVAQKLMPPDSTELGPTDLKKIENFMNGF